VVSDDCDDANPLVYVCDGDTDGGDTDGGDTDGGDTDTDTDTGAGLDTDVWSDTEDTDSALDSGPAEDGSATDTDDVASDDVASEGGCGCASGGGMPVHGLFAAGGAVLLAAGRRFRGRRPR
jgi:MYXO-CTERM domain-containing protein